MKGRKRLKRRGIKRKKLPAAAILLLWMLLLPFCAGAQAQDVDLTCLGSLVIMAAYGTGEERCPVSGIDFSLYRVAGVKETPEGFCYVAEAGLEDLEEEMNTGCGGSQSQELAARLSDLDLEAYKISEEVTKDDGRAVFDELSCGLYLADAQSFDFAAEPFLAGIPYPGQEAWLYDVWAFPKLEPVLPASSSDAQDTGNLSLGGDSDGSVYESGDGGEDEPGEAGEDPGEQLNPPEPDLPHGLLPQTGLLQLRLLAAVVFGLFLIRAGLWLGTCTKKREDADEKDDRV